MAQVIDVKIQSKADVKKGFAFPDLSGKPFFESSIERIAVLEGGMESGRTSVALIFTAPPGEKYAFALCQISALQIEQIAQVVRGAALRFGDPQ